MASSWYGSLSSHVSGYVEAAREYRDSKGKGRAAPAAAPQPGEGDQPAEQTARAGDEDFRPDVTPAAAQVDGGAGHAGGTPIPPLAQEVAATATLSPPHGDPASAALSRNASTASNASAASGAGGIAKYKERLMKRLPVGQFEIENATGVPLNVSLEQVGPLHYAVVKPGEVFSQMTGKVWFSIVVRVHTGPASEYSKWSVAWPIMLMAGPSAAAISLAAIPLVVLATGTVSLTALVATAVEGVSAAIGTLTTSLGFANKLPFASKYRSKAISAARSSAGDAQKFAQDVINTMQSKGGPKGMWEDWRARHTGAEPKLVDMGEQPLSVHDISDCAIEEVFDVVDGEGPKGWRKKRKAELRRAFQECKLVDRGWYAGREPVLRVTGGPRIVEIENPFPKSANEKRRVLEFWPLRLEKVVAAADGTGEPVAEEVAVGNGTAERRTVEETVRKAAEAIREDA